MCAIVSAAFLVPVAVGANRRLMVQLEPALTLPAQVSVLLNSLLFTPVLAKLVMVKIALPLFATVTTLGALVLPAGRFAKATSDAERLTRGTPPPVTPVPDKGRLSGLVVALLVIVTLAALAPASLGVKVTSNVQLVPAARRLAPREHGAAPAADKAKSAPCGPVTAMFVMFSVALPLLVLVRVTLCAALVVPTVCVAKLRLAEDSVTAAAAPEPATALTTSN